MNWIELRAGTEAVEDILGMIGKQPIEKAANPLSRRGYLKLVRDLSRELVRVVRPVETKALADALQALEQNWAHLSDEGKRRVFENAMRTVSSAAPRVRDRIGEVLTSAGMNVIEQTRVAQGRLMGDRVRWDDSATDERLVQYLRDTQSHYISDEYGRRAESLSATARDVVAEGLNNGFDGRQIGMQLSEALKDTSVSQSLNYYQTISNIFVARTRSYGQLTSFDSGGISGYQFQAVLDEVTSEMCRFLHGRVFSVKASLQRFYDVIDSEDPQAVKQLQPFIQRGKDDSGEEFLFVNRGETRLRVADVVTPAYGNADQRGEYRSRLSTAELERLGVTTPPLHGNCRSTLVPVF